MHCLDQWQETALQSNIPERATTCSICKCKYRYPSWIFMIYRRCAHLVKYHINVGLAVCSLLWLSFVTIPLKIFVHSLLVLVTLPFGSFSLNGFSLTWIGYDFPPQLAIVHDGNGETVPDLLPGVLLVATKAIPQSSIFYKSVVLILEHSAEFGSKGVILNSVSRGVTVSGFSVGNGGPMEQEMCTVVHNSRVCSRYSYVLNQYESVYVADCENAYPTIRQLAFAQAKQSASHQTKCAKTRAAPLIIASTTTSNSPGSATISTTELNSAQSGGDKQQGRRPLLTAPAAAAVPSVRVLRGTCGWISNQLDGEVLAGLWHILPGSQNHLFAPISTHEENAAPIVAAPSVAAEGAANIGRSLYRGRSGDGGMPSVHDTHYWEKLNQVVDSEVVRS